MPEKHEIPLIVERDGPPADKLGIVVEEGAEHAPDAEPEPRAEVVQDDLRPVPGDSLVVATHFRRYPDVAQLEVRRRPVREMDDEQPVRLLPVLVHDQYVRVVLPDCAANHLLDARPVPVQAHRVRDYPRQFTTENTRFLKKKKITKSNIHENFLFSISTYCFYYGMFTFEKFQTIFFKRFGRKFFFLNDQRSVCTFTSLRF